MATLLDGVTADGAGTGVSHTSPASVFVTGTFDGATVYVQVSADDTTYVDAETKVSDNKSAVISPGVVNTNVNGTYYIRCVVSGAGPDTNIDAETTS